MAKDSYLYPSSVWLINSLKRSKARSNRQCDLCKIAVFQNEDYPGEYLKINQKSILCVRCAFRLVSHPDFRYYQTFTYDQIMSLDHNLILFYKKIKDIYKYNCDYKKLIYLDRQKEGKILTDADFEKYPTSYEK